VPFDGSWEDGGLLRELLGVVLAEVHLLGGLLVQGQDVVGRLQLRDCDETDLHAHWQISACIR
jgi:hypothetical protein